MSSPTQRSLKELRRLGWTAAVVEHWNQHAKIRQDLFGFIDVIAMAEIGTDGGRYGGFYAIQSTTTANQSKRIAKIKEEPRALTWLQAGGRIFVHGWLKSKKDGRWKLTETEVFETDFA